jgi:PPOX class probable F420-dependent enzyme
MPRDRGVTMTAEEVVALLDAKRTVTLGTIGPDGLPHLASMWFAREGDDVMMWTYRRSQKARNIERDPRASVLAEAGDSYTELRGVCLDCRVEVIRDPEAVLHLGRFLHARYGGTAIGDDEQADALLRAQAGKRVGLRLEPKRIRSWDHRRL